jgi:hypothetical protein
MYISHYITLYLHFITLYYIHTLLYIKNLNIIHYLLYVKILLHTKYLIMIKANRCRGGLSGDFQRDDLVLLS